MIIYYSINTQNEKHCVTEQPSWSKNTSIKIRHTQLSDAKPNINFSWSNPSPSILIHAITTNQQPCQQLHGATNSCVLCAICWWDPAVTHSAAVPPRLGSGHIPRRHTCHNSYFAWFLLNLPNKRHLTRNAWRAKTMCSQCGQVAAKPNPIWSAVIESDAARDWLCGGTTRWRSGTNTSAVTSACWLNTTSCTVVQYSWLTAGWSYTNTRADCYRPPALHGGDRLAGNEAKRHGRTLCAVPCESTLKNPNSCTHLRPLHSHMPVY